MSLVHKIPPLVSALAFGYGVGMAAPESTVTSMQAAVVAYQHASHKTPPRVAQAPLPPPKINSNGIGGDESRELGKLRDTVKDKERASCDLDRPSFSRTPKLESRSESELWDADDLDTSGTEALSRLQLPDIKLAVTRRTLKYVKFFTRTERGRGMFEAWLKRSGRYQEMIQSELREWRMPEDLIWVSMIESGFDARIKSPAGAMGLWQFMPATGAVYGLIQNRFLDQRKNPRLATRAAAHHLRDLYRRFGNWDLALAAYNMGYEQLLNAIDKYGTADFNELARQEAIPQETSSYVPKIAAAAIVANNLEHFGFDRVEIQRPLDASELAAPAGTSLKTIAKAAGVTTATIRALNPDFLSDRVPPGRGDYLVMIPPDTVSRARAVLPVLLDSEPIVTEDAKALDAVDLLTGREMLRRRTASDDDSLLSLLPPPRKRRTLRDPFAGGDEERDEVRDRDDRDDRDEEVIGRRLAPRDDDHPARILGKPRRGRETVVYKVSPGDTLSSIAKQFAIDADDIARKNKLDDGEPLAVGSMLKLRVKRDQLDNLDPLAKIGPRDDKENKKRDEAKHERGDKNDDKVKAHARRQKDGDDAARRPSRERREKSRKKAQ